MKSILTAIAALMMTQITFASTKDPIRLTGSDYKAYVDVKTPVTFVGIAKVAPENAEKFKSIAKSFEPIMRAQSGNIYYDLQQSLSDKTEFMWIEEWKDGKSLADHMDSKAVSQLLGKIGGLFSPGFPKIVILKKNN